MDNLPDVITTGFDKVDGLAGGFNGIDLLYQSPLLALVVGGLLIVLLDAFAKGGSRRWLMWAGLAFCAITLMSAVGVWRALDSGPRLMFSGMLVADRFGMLLTIGVAAGAMLTLLLAGEYMKEHSVEYGEFYALTLFAASGMVMLIMASDLVSVFLGIETMSLGVYVLTGSFRKNRKSTEAAMKYFLAGAFVSGILLYGIALVYGMTGTTSLAGIAQVAGRVDTNLVFLIGMFMLLAAFAFKVAAVPFHMWAPDAYEGAPTPVTAFMSTGVKAAGVAGLIRVFSQAFGGDVLPFGHMGWATLVMVGAAATMTLGNLVAIRQDNVKRMLAYSSISHAGYILVGVAAAGLSGKGAVHDAAVSSTLYYLIAYTFTAVGAFGVVAWIGRKGDERLVLDDWAGLGQRHAGAAFAMTLFMLSLGGMPPLAGFFGKFYVLRAAIEVEGGVMNWLVILAAINSVVSIYYYLRVVMAMYFREPTREHKPLNRPAIIAVLIIAALMVVEMGLMPNWWTTLTSASVL